MFNSPHTVLFLANAFSQAQSPVMDLRAPHCNSPSRGDSISISFCCVPKAAIMLHSLPYSRQFLSPSCLESGSLEVSFGMCGCLWNCGSCSLDSFSPDWWLVMRQWTLPIRLSHHLHRVRDTSEKLSAQALTQRRFALPGVWAFP